MNVLLWNKILIITWEHCMKKYIWIRLVLLDLLDRLAKFLLRLLYLLGKVIRAAQFKLFRLLEDYTHHGFHLILPAVIRSGQSS